MAKKQSTEKWCLGPSYYSCNNSSKNNEVKQHHSHHTRCSVICAVVWTWPKFWTPALRSDLWLPELYERTFATSDRMRNANIEKNSKKWHESTVSKSGGWETLLQPDKRQKTAVVLALSNFASLLWFQNICCAVCKETRSYVQNGLCVHATLSVTN